MSTEDWYQVWRGINIVLGVCDLVAGGVLIHQHFRVRDPVRTLLQALMFMILVMWSLSIQSFILGALGHETNALTPHAVGLTAGMSYTLWALLRLRRVDEGKNDDQ